MRMTAMVAGLAALACLGGASTGGARTTDKPNFAVRALLPVATAGAPYTYSFCQPLAATANGVCGSLKRPSTNPSGGGGPPYVFRLRPGSGFPPTGLALSNRTGILTGTVAANALARNYTFTVCAGSNRSNGETCKATTLPVVAAPKPKDAFVGTWKGTYTYTYALRGYCNGKTFAYDGAATVVIEQSGTGYGVNFTLVGGTRETSGCQIVSRTDMSFGYLMTAATPATITYKNWALTLQGDALVGTFNADDAETTYRIQLTLNRA
jgi:hypothetical protein